MSYFLLPTLPYNKNIHKHIEYVNDKSENIKNKINITLSKYLQEQKNKIETNTLKWEKYKKYTNSYEFIHTPVNSKASNMPICKIKPLSRSYFKMIEICKQMEILDTLSSVIKSFHFAEGPGGFIEALAYMRENKEDTYNGMTLINNSNISVPGWKKSQVFLNKNTNVSVEKGVTEDGNIMDPDNLIHIFKSHSNSCELVTGDGGFDYTNSFHSQELITLPLILSQVAFAIACQKTGGSFILKVFDLYTQTSIDILYLLSVLYDKVYISKPNTSRYANSEKYIICKGFRVTNTKKIVNKFYKILSTFKESETSIHKDKLYPRKLLNISVPLMYTSKLEEYNSIIGQQQLETMVLTFNYIFSYIHFNENNIKKKNIQKCIHWCKQNNLPYNKVYLTDNIFLTPKKNSFKLGFKKNRLL